METEPERLGFAVMRVVPMMLGDAGTAHAILRA
jgi:hypothetical protein